MPKFQAFADDHVKNPTFGDYMGYGRLPSQMQSPNHKTDHPAGIWLRCGMFYLFELVTNCDQFPSVTTNLAISRLFRTRRQFGTLYIPPW